MPDITLTLPQPSRFNSSLNEIDMVFGLVLQYIMRIADPRDLTGNPNSHGQDEDWLWTMNNIFQVDELDTIAIFDTWLLRNQNKKVDVKYPLLAYEQKDLDTVFWGTGNRYRQWYMSTPLTDENWNVGDIVVIKKGRLRGYRAEIVETFPDQSCTLRIQTETPYIIRDAQFNPQHFYFEDLTPTGSNIPPTFKAKAVTGKYHCAILVDTRDEAQYIRDHFILRCADANIWFKYNSPTLNNTENQIYTVFGIPNLDRYPTTDDRLKAKGYIYGLGFETNVWATATDTPLPAGIIEQIHLNLRYKDTPYTQRILVTN